VRKLRIASIAWCYGAGKTNTVILMITAKLDILALMIY
jgi:hypothetical protein